VVADDADSASAPSKPLGSARKIADALAESGYPVRVIEGDETLLTELLRFFHPDTTGGTPGGIVLNLAHGLRGEAGGAQVPGLLEMAGIPYTGPTPFGAMLEHDRALSRLALREAGVPTPGFRVMTGHKDDSHGLHFPVTIRPRHQAGVKPRTIRHHEN